MSEKEEERGEERTEKLHETWRGWREQRQTKMGVKRESEMILVKEEESEIRRGTRREKMEAKNKGEKTEGRGRMSFFSSTHLLFLRLCWRRGLYFDLALRFSPELAR